ncbi:uncharacterized protein BO95DRAFT_268163 [Aspergillus brunneoviolaceus CBS 621.78]|uniref:Uncharacterized protein n=1 Tax=Aspergillus brunneoviolaceus CBS 621.78 TaxID=1450534 RepID=A0ACD1FWX8_9EURO|nr:hypothetical protein BO95DRAFT_268163 [Aspergillus brunneoviolaceus CBS 621.78]RAH41459.1 hypothetical protein BO95DRAFT_268163 [Aspergillus brunneoviolaceus CBS 621.78]
MIWRFFSRSCSSVPLLIPLPVTGDVAHVMGDGTSGLALVGLFQTRPNFFSAASHWIGLARALSGCCFSCNVPRPLSCLAVSTFPTFHAETVPKGLGRYSVVTMGFLFLLLFFLHG